MMHPHDDSRNYVGKKGNLLGSILFAKKNKTKKKQQQQQKNQEKTKHVCIDLHLISIHPGSVRPYFDFSKVFKWCMALKSMQVEL